MRQFKILGVALAAALLVAACGGSDDAVVQAPAIKYTSLVSFGDSLSDVGTHKVGAVAALGGGTYSVNGITGAIGDSPTPSKNWTELLAAQIGVAAPCPAQTGLNSAASLGGPVPVVDYPNCRNYAQGGARVTNPVGPGSASAPVNSPLGQLTVPLVTQISRHLTRVGGSFSGTELVTVMAGGNDVLRLLDDLVAKATAAGSAAFGKALVGGLVALVPNPADQPAAAVAIGTAVATAAAAPGATPTSIVTAAVTAASAQPGVSLPINPAPIVAAASAAAASAGAAYAQNNGANEAVLPMGVAGKELATYIKSQIVGKGAKYVAVVNLPDVSSTPSAKAQSAETRGLILNMAIYFNEVLAYELRGTPGVLVVDVFTESRSQIANPGAYGLTNVTTPACNLNATTPTVPGNGLADPAKPESGTSLVCNAGNLKPGDVSKYLFADTVHPTPYGYKLLADLVNKTMKQAGWL
ncbi:SGNH/GDSL hydrolase family protein [Rhodoferax sp.]|uniref:SGNH/GDSL hydrolase family protein n=1 Tax=Rhodoferax sp. TaxID=50421 RepID=UPI0025CFE0E6|nr:SGNH/GDSL hydrolase family protein [Rhodoferax sp.]